MALSSEVLIKPAAILHNHLLDYTLLLIIVDAMALSIIHYPHPTLQHRSRPIIRVDAKLREMAAEMLDLMYDNEGVGLAANQVDLPIRMFVANASGERGEGQEWVVINPVIDRPKGSDADQEGCLSVPGVYAQVKRSKTVRLQGYDLQGNEINEELDGFLSRVVQHEVDHLDGVMFFDRIGSEAMRDIEHAIAEFQTTFESLRNTGSIPDDAELARRLTEWEKKYT